MQIEILINIGELEVYKLQIHRFRGQLVVLVIIHLVVIWAVKLVILAKQFFCCPVKLCNINMVL
jgi:hypothetical protein